MKRPPIKMTPRPKPLRLDDAQLVADADRDGLTLKLRPKDGGRVLQMPRKKR